MVTAASSTVVVLYVVDGNRDGKSDMNKLPGPAWNGNLTFTSAIDMFIPAKADGSTRFEYNGRVLNVPTRKSSEAGSVSVVFN